MERFSIMPYNIRGGFSKQFLMGCGGGPNTDVRGVKRREGVEELLVTAVHDSPETPKNYKSSPRFGLGDPDCGVTPPGEKVCW